MLLYLDESIVEYISTEHKIIKETTDVIRNLNSVAQSFYDGIHLVSASLKTLQFLANLELLEYIPKHVYQYLVDDYTFSDFESFVEKKIILYINKPKKAVEDDFLICIDTFRHFDKSMLISESLLDCDFYLRLANKMKDEYTNTQNSLSTIDINFRRSHCGGSDAFRTTENTLKDMYFILLIMDSDKTHCRDKVGSSCKTAVNVYSKHKSTSIISLEILRVREKENLVPPSFLCLCGHLNGTKEFLECLLLLEKQSGHEEFLRHIDIKDGVKLKEYQAMYDHYKNSFDLLDAHGLLNTSGDNLDHRITIGIGDKFLENFSEDILGTGLETKMDKAISNNAPEKCIQSYKGKIEKKEKLFCSIPTYIHDDWHRIYTQVLQFGCCLSKSERQQIYY